MIAIKTFKVNNNATSITIDDSNNIYYIVESSLMMIKNGSDKSSLLYKGCDNYTDLICHKKTLYLSSCKTGEISCFSIITQLSSTLVKSSKIGHNDGKFECAKFNGPTNICMDMDKNLLVIDYKYIRKLNCKKKIVTTINISQPNPPRGVHSCPGWVGICADKSGAVYISNFLDGYIIKHHNDKSTIIAKIATNKWLPENNAITLTRCPQNILINKHGHLIFHDNHSIGIININSVSPSVHYVKLSQHEHIWGMTSDYNGDIYLIVDKNIIKFEYLWNIHRLFWIAHHKNNLKCCYLSKVPRDIIREICSYIH